MSTKRTTTNGIAVLEKPEAEAALTRPGPTVSERFVAEVEKQFLAEMGQGVQFNALERRLAQHMYLAVDQALKAAEEKRTKGWTAEKLANALDDPRAFTWRHVDRQALAMDTVDRVSLGLDALMPGHLWPVPYFNNAKGLYDVDLRIGYIGRDYVTRRFALEEPIDVIYELVYSTDQFKALPRSATRDVEGYEFEITSPFDRGEIVGGFGYVTYQDPRKNRLILVTQRDFKRASDASKSDFWAKNSVEMHLKTIYHRVAGKIPLDPTKVNSSALAAMREDDRSEVEVAAARVEAAALANANRRALPLSAPEPDIETIDVAAAEPEAEPVPLEDPEEDVGSFAEAPF